MTSQEEHWVAQARNGDAQAFRRLVEGHARPLFHLCARITRDPTLAEDAVQEALYNAWKHLRDFDGRASLKTWLHRIAVNAALEQLRRNARHEAAPTKTVSEDEGDGEDFLLRVASDEPAPDEQAQGAQIRRDTNAELQRMSMLERTAFLLRHYEGQSLEDISTTMSMSISACKQAIFRAVRKLRGALEPLR
jgi:RNA polymerase sigma-70 factor, ECF subfamily